MTEGAFFKVKDRLPGSWSTNSVPKSKVSCLPSHSKGTNAPRKPSPLGIHPWTSVSSSAKWVCEKQGSLDDNNNENG